MKATILLGTLKKSGLSNTETLCEFLTGRMAKHGIHSNTVKLVNHRIEPGTSSNMGGDDEWPGILDLVLDAEILIIATPIWWNNQSSLAQRAIERLDEMHDQVMAGKPSPLDGKAGGIVITGDSDGAQTIIANLCNFFNAVGVVVPPFATLSVLWERQAKSATATKEELMKKYEADYASTADRMIGRLVKAVEHERR
jgi:multimeric flavodoxin WrbA